MSTQVPVALVMAASRGIGLGCAQALGAQQYRLVICSRDNGRLNEAVAALTEQGSDVTGLRTDVSRPDDIGALFDHVKTRFGRLDVLVVNAGGPPPGDFEDCDDASWEQAFNLTLMSAVRAIRRAIPLMREGNSGRILVIGSSSAKRPIEGLCLSNAYRPALAGLVKSLAGEVAKAGITVNMICPGRIDTDRVNQLDAQRAEQDGVDATEVRRLSEASIPLERYGTPRELGDLVGFLASQAASYITGQTISVDGGQVITLP